MDASPHSTSDQSRIATLEATVDELRQQLAGLIDTRTAARPVRRTKVRAASPISDARSGRALSRRGVLLGGAGAAAASAVAVLASSSPAGATDGQALIVGQNNTMTNVTTLTKADLSTSIGAAYINATSGSNNATLEDGGLVVTSSHSQTAAGISGVSASQDGAVTAVSGTSGTGIGVYGNAVAKSSFTAVAGVIGESSTNYGTCGFSTSKSGVRAASTSAEGVKATSTSGVGGSFSGGRAAINIVPTGTTGHPTTGAHNVGDVVVDKNGALFLCITSGTPGTWVKVTVTAA